MNASDNYRDWAELADGLEGQQFVRLVEIADALGITPNRVVTAALDLKRESAEHVRGHIFWLNGVPWLSVALVAVLESKIKSEIVANVQAQVDEANTAARARRN